MHGPGPRPTRSTYRKHFRLLSRYDSLTKREQRMLDASTDRFFRRFFWKRDLTKITNPLWRKPAPPGDQAAVLADLRTLYAACKGGE